MVASVRRGGMPAKVGDGDFGAGILEPLRGLFTFVVSAGPSLAAGYTARPFIDGLGQSAAGGVSLVEGDANLFGGQIPSNVGYECHALTHYAYISDSSAVPSDAALLALTTNVWVRMYYAGMHYDLGLLADFMGPYGSPTGMNNVTFPKRFGWPWLDESEPLLLRPGQQFWLEYKVLRALTAGVTASKNYNFVVQLPCRKLTINDARLKQ